MKKSLNHAYSNLDWFVILCVFMFPVAFLTLRHGVHAPLFALLTIAGYCYWQGETTGLKHNSSLDVIVFLTFSGLILSVLFSQVFRGTIHFAAFDGPSRILIAGIVFLFLKQLKIPYIRILSISIPVGLISTFISLKLNPGAYWDGKFATYFVDPNTLGTQSFILGLIALLVVRFYGKSLAILTALQVVGGLMGIYISIGSGSRGAWMVVPFIVLLLILLRMGDISLAAKSKRKKMWIETGILFLMGLISLTFIFYNSSSLSARLYAGYFDARNWFDGSDLSGSVGIRLSMWKFGLQFANESLLFGYGEEKNMHLVLQNSPLNTLANETAINVMAGTGPHSDILSKLLSAGLLGLGAYLCLLLIPFSIFWKHRNAQCFNVKQAARVGLFYITGIFISGFSNEQLSLKYLCTFYGLMIATLLAQVLYKPSAEESSRQPSVV